MFTYLVDYSRYVLALTNAILLLWLGLTVLLNSDERRVGVWIVSGSLLLGSGFFISYLALRIIGFGAITFTGSLFLAVASLPPVVLPFAWYGVILWYSGYFNENAQAFRQRQRGRLGLLVGLLVCGLVALVLLGLPYVPGVGRATFALWDPIRPIVRVEVAGVPLVMIVYPVYTLLCILFSLDALRQPASSERVMGAEAQRRAPPRSHSRGHAIHLTG